MITVPALAVVPKVEPKALIRINREDQWQTEAVMSLSYATELAKECRKRGLQAEVVEHG